MKLWSAFGAAGLLCTIASAQSVSVDDGNVFISTADGSPRQLTSSGHDRDPVLSPDHRWIVFVRSAAGNKILTSGAEGVPAELWQIRIDGKNLTLLARTRAGEDMKQVIADFENLQFSPDGTLLYFMTPAWATSAALHVVDTRTAKEHFVCASNAFEILQNGKYGGHLLVSQHRYFLGGGSYDWFWLFTPDAKKLGPVGEETDNFKSLWADEQPHADGDKNVPAARVTP